MATGEEEKANVGIVAIKINVDEIIKLFLGISFKYQHVSASL